jgi:hypothetical protein
LIRNAAGNEADCGAEDSRQVRESLLRFNPNPILHVESWRDRRGTRLSSFEVLLRNQLLLPRRGSGWVIGILIGTG